MSQKDFSDQRPVVNNTPSLKNTGPFLARVVNNIDVDYSGAIYVQTIHEGSTGTTTYGETIKAYYLSHYWSGTAQEFNGTANTFQDTQKT